MSLDLRQQVGAARGHVTAGMLVRSWPLCLPCAWPWRGATSAPLAEPTARPTVAPPPCQRRTTVGLTHCNATFLVGETPTGGSTRRTSALLDNAMMCTVHYD
jgi:hypothetical protein